jgi:hypothetical protein
MRRPRFLSINHSLGLLVVIANIGWSPDSEAASKRAEQPSFAVETPKADGTQPKKPLKGNLEVSNLGAEAFATAATNKPLLQGTVVHSVPTNWNGIWQGGVQLNKLAAVGSTNVLESGAIEIELKMEEGKPARSIFDLEARQLSSGAQSGSEQKYVAVGPTLGQLDPDIHYWHEGTVNHLDIKNGAQMIVRGPMVVGGGNPNETSVVTVSGSGSYLGGTSSGSGRSDAVMPGSSGTDYNNGAISTAGQTDYRGRYFKSDDKLALNGANIHADRVDIGDHSTMPGARTLTATGSGQVGYLLQELGGLTTYLAPNGPSAASASPSPVSLINAQSQPTIVHVATGVYDIRTETMLKTPSGISGKQEVIMRLTNLSADRMMVQMTMQNYDLQNRLVSTFATSGYMHR